jgi:hypothetical protein
MEVGIVSTLDSITVRPAYIEGRPVMVSDDNNNREPDVTDRVLVEKTEDGWEEAEAINSSVSFSNMDKIGFWNRPLGASGDDVEIKNEDVEQYDEVKLNRNTGSWEIGGELIKLKNCDEGRDSAVLHIETRPVRGNRDIETARVKLEEKNDDDKNWFVEQNDNEPEFKADKAQLDAESKANLDVKKDITNGRTNTAKQVDNFLVIPSAISRKPLEHCYAVDLNKNGLSKGAYEPLLQRLDEEEKPQNVSHLDGPIGRKAMATEYPLWVDRFVKDGASELARGVDRIDEKDKDMDEMFFIGSPCFRNLNEDGVVPFPDLGATNRLGAQIIPSDDCNVNGHPLGILMVFEDEIPPIQTMTIQDGIAKENNERPNLNEKLDGALVNDEVEYISEITDKLASGEYDKAIEGDENDEVYPNANRIAEEVDENGDHIELDLTKMAKEAKRQETITDFLDNTDPEEIIKYVNGREA